MKIILLNAKGDTVIEVDLITEAERILQEYQSKGCAIVTEDGVDVMPIKTPMPDEIYILWPMAGG